MEPINSVYQPGIEGDLPRSERASKTSLEERREEQRRRRQKRRPDSQRFAVDTFEPTQTAEEGA